MLGELISGGASIIGGLFGKSSAEKANKANIKLQKEFAQNGIQWKVADAKAAGLHPLAALGAQTTAFSPSVVGDTSFGTGIAQAGQDVGRAINSTRTQGQKADAYTKTVQDLSIQRMGLENTLLASQIAKTNQAGSPPDMPTATQRYLVDGQGEGKVSTPNLPSGTPLISDQPLQRVVSDPSAPFQEPGAINDLGFARTSTGHTPIPSGDMKQRIDDDLIGTLIWNLRNRLLPTVGLNRTPPYKAPRGSHWEYDRLRQEYQLVGPANGGGGW